MTGLGRLLWVGSLLVLAATLAGCASNGGAYGGRGFGGGPGRMPRGPSVDEIIEELQLAEDQTPEIRGVLQASEDERSEIMTKHAGTRHPAAFEEARADIDGLRARTEMMLEPLLTEAQLVRYRRIIDRAEAERERVAEEMKARRPAGPGGGRGGRPGF